MDGNCPEWRALHGIARKTRSWRGAVIGAEVFAIVLAFTLIAAFAPWWSWLIVAAVAMPPLARKGRPAHRPILQSAVTTPLIRKISTDAIIRAYERAGLCSTDPKKPADHLGFGSTMSRDALDKGSQVDVYLPYGGTFASVVNAKPKIASGLDVLESQVYFTPDKKSERRHTLRVLDTDPLSEPAGPTPLLDCKQRSIWRKVPFGLDQFGRKVAFCLMWISLLIGAQPRRGKTFAGRAHRAVRRAGPVRQHHPHRREGVEGLAAAPVRRPPVHPGHPPDQGRRPGSARPRRAVRDRPAHRPRQRGARQAARVGVPRGQADREARTAAPTCT